MAASRRRREIQPNPNGEQPGYLERIIAVAFNRDFARWPPTFACHHPAAWRNSQRRLPEARGSHGRHIGTPVRLCSHATAGHRCRRLHGFAASQLGSNISPHPSSCSNFFGNTHFRLNQHQHDSASARAGGVRHPTPQQTMPENLLEATSARVTCRERSSHVARAPSARRHLLLPVVRAVRGRQKLQLASWFWCNALPTSDARL